MSVAELRRDGKQAWTCPGCKQQQSLDLTPAGQEGPALQRADPDEQDRDPAGQPGGHPLLEQPGRQRPAVRVKLQLPREGATVSVSLHVDAAARKPDSGMDSDPEDVEPVPHEAEEEEEEDAVADIVVGSGMRLRGVKHRARKVRLSRLPARLLFRGGVKANAAAFASSALFGHAIGSRGH